MPIITRDSADMGIAKNIKGSGNQSLRNTLPPGFDAISVREKSAVPVIQLLTGKKVQIVLDPTLLLDWEDYEEIKVQSKRVEPYILIYMMEYNRELVKFADKLSCTMDLPIIQRKPGKIFRNELENYYTHTPGEFLDIAPVCIGCQNGSFRLWIG